MQRVFFACFALFALSGAGYIYSQASQEKASVVHYIPAPADMTADVRVAGRISQLKHIDISYVGKKIPYTYSDNKIANSPGYDWWVSKHFALKSDLPEEKIRLYLELLELSYPHYVELFGAEPANIERQRIAVVYGSSRTKLRDSMMDDGFRRGVHANAGGETMYYNRAGYSFPSSREQHQRYIVIHETMHAYHMALTGHSTWAPNWITEGLADSIASHVYYPDKKQLAVMVFDRAPMNYIDTGLRQYYEANKPSIEQINDDPALKRGLNFFIIHFLLSDPERAQYFELFRDNLMAANPHSDATLPTANKLLRDTFPNWDKLESDFADFVTSVRASFHIASGPWEQDGNGYWIRIYKEKQMPRLDINLQPGQSALAIGKQLDFPGPEHNALLDPIHGGEQPSIGFVLDYHPEQIKRGEIGIAMGVKLAQQNLNFRKTHKGKKDNSKDSLLSLTVIRGQKLVLKGQNFELDYQAAALSSGIQIALKNSHQLAVSVKLKGKQLTTILRAGRVTQKVDFIIPNEAQQNQLKEGSLALLAQDVSHKITPYFVSNRQAIDVAVNKASNPWQFEDMSNLQRVFRACQLQKDKCNPSLNSIYQQVKDSNKHGKARFAIQKLEQELLHNNALLKLLAGIKLTVEYHQQQPFLRLENPTDNDVEIEAKVRWFDSTGKQLGEKNQAHSLSHGIHNISLDPEDGAAEVMVESNVIWQGQALAFSETKNVSPFDGVYLTAQVEKKQDQVIVKVNLTGPYSGSSEGQLTYELLPSKSSNNPVLKQKVVFKPYESNDYQQQFTVTDSSESNLAIEVSADLVVDGEDVRLVEQLFLE